MSPRFPEKIVLGIAGLTAGATGALILIAPSAFYRSYGIALDGTPSLLSELRAPAAGLAAFGVLMLLGIWRDALAPVSRTLALTVFLAFPAGRLLGIAVEGLPSAGILAALAAELVIALLCLLAFRPAAGRAALPLADPHP